MTSHGHHLYQFQQIALRVCVYIRGVSARKLPVEHSVLWVPCESMRVWRIHVRARVYELVRGACCPRLRGNYIPCCMFAVLQQVLLLLLLLVVLEDLSVFLFRTGSGWEFHRSSSDEFVHNCNKLHMQPKAHAQNHLVFMGKCAEC